MDFFYLVPVLTVVVVVVLLMPLLMPMLGVPKPYTFSLVLSDLCVRCSGYSDL